MTAQLVNSPVTVGRRSAESALQKSAWRSVTRRVACAARADRERIGGIGPRRDGNVPERSGRSGWGWRRGRGEKAPGSWASSSAARGRGEFDWQSPTNTFYRNVDITHIQYYYNITWINKCLDLMCVFICMYIYIYAHARTHTSISIWTQV